ncbi:MAG TPA: diaminopropionate ammonia-lyase [Bacillota bacterium]|nr:diaminopropionate ammonia-lyase [Bacillota bacterium]
MDQFASANIQFARNQLKNMEDFKQYASDFSKEAVLAIQRFQQTHPNFKETPLRRLKHLADHLGVGDIFVKDESYRFGLNAFKVLGGIYAIGQYLAKKLNKDIATLSFADLKASDVKQTIGHITFITATDGNHGRGVAWAARELGQKAVVYMPKGASSERIEAIEREGATVKVIDGNYDTAVRLAAETAEENGWIVLQDTSWENYEEIPNWVMQGYSSLGLEIVEQLAKIDAVKPTHLFLQVGVGSYAAGIAAFMTNYYIDHPPKIVLVEPDGANCFYQSFFQANETYEIVDGDLQTIMAGLSCGKPNPKAWDILKSITIGGISANDRLAALGMRLLGHPLPDDPRIISGESGAATLGAVYHLLTDQQQAPLREYLSLDETSRVLLINTEGDTDEAHYRQVVWEGAHPLHEQG